MIVLLIPLLLLSLQPYTWLHNEILTIALGLQCFFISNNAQHPL